MSASAAAASNPHVSVGAPYVTNSKVDVLAPYGVVGFALFRDALRATPIFNRTTESVMGCGAGGATELRRPITTSMPSSVPSVSRLGSTLPNTMVANPDVALGLSRSPPVPAALLSHAPL